MLLRQERYAHTPCRLLPFLPFHESLVFLVQQELLPFRHKSVLFFIPKLELWLHPFVGCLAHRGVELVRVAVANTADVCDLEGFLAVLRLDQPAKKLVVLLHVSPELVDAVIAHVINVRGHLGANQDRAVVADVVIPLIRQYRRFPFLFAWVPAIEDLVVALPAEDDLFEFGRLVEDVVSVLFDGVCF